MEVNAQVNSLGEQPADPLLAVVGGDDEPQLADVAAPADSLEHGDIADDMAVDEGDETMAVGDGDPAGDHRGVADVLLEERAVALGDGGEELHEGIDVLSAERAHLDIGACSRGRCSPTHARRLYCGMR